MLISVQAKVCLQSKNELQQVVILEFSLELKFQLHQNYEPTVILLESCTSIQINLKVLNIIFTSCNINQKTFFLLMFKVALVFKVAPLDGTVLVKKCPNEGWVLENSSRTPPTPPRDLWIEMLIELCIYTFKNGGPIHFSTMI